MPDPISIGTFRDKRAQCIDVQEALSALESLISLITCGPRDTRRSRFRNDMRGDDLRVVQAIGRIRAATDPGSELA